MNKETKFNFKITFTSFMCVKQSSADSLNVNDCYTFIICLLYDSMPKSMYY